MKLHFLMQDTRALYGAERATLRLVSGLAAAGVEKLDLAYALDVPGRDERRF